MMAYLPLTSPQLTQPAAQRLYLHNQQTKARLPVNKISCLMKTIIKRLNKYHYGNRSKNVWQTQKEIRRKFKKRKRYHQTKLF